MKRSTAILVAIATALGIFFFIVIPLENMKEQAMADIPAKASEIAKYRKFIKKYTGEKSMLKMRRQRLKALEDAIIMEKDASLAAAAVQSKLQDMAEIAGVKINTLRSLAPKQGDAYTMLPVFLDGRGSMQQISRLLNQIDSSWTMLGVDNLEVHKQSSRRDMRLKIQVSGVMKNEQ